MTYVKEMAFYLRDEVAVEEYEGAIEKIITDTKRACLELLEYNMPFEPIPLWRCKQIIWLAQPRAERINERS